MSYVLRCLDTRNRHNGAHCATKKVGNPRAVARPIEMALSRRRLNVLIHQNHIAVRIDDGETGRAGGVFIRFCKQ